MLGPQVLAWATRSSPARPAFGTWSLSVILDLEDQQSSHEAHSSGFRSPPPPPPPPPPDGSVERQLPGLVVQIWHHPLWQQGPAWRSPRHSRGLSMEPPPILAPHAPSATSQPQALGPERLGP